MINEGVQGRNTRAQDWTTGNDEIIKGRGEMALGRNHGRNERNRKKFSLRRLNQNTRGAGTTESTEGDKVCRYGKRAKQTRNIEIKRIRDKTIGIKHKQTYAYGVSQERKPK